MNSSKNHPFQVNEYLLLIKNSNNYVTFSRRNTDTKSAPATPMGSDHALPIDSMMTRLQASSPPSPLDWDDRGAADGLSNQHDSDFGGFTLYFIL